MMTNLLKDSIRLIYRKNEVITIRNKKLLEKKRFIA